MQEVKCFKTSDNNIFEDFEEAKKHEKKLCIKDSLRAELADYITIKRYNDFIYKANRSLESFTRCDLIDFATQIVLDNFEPFIKIYDEVELWNYMKLLKLIITWLI